VDTLHPQDRRRERRSSDSSNQSPQSGGDRRRRGIGLRAGTAASSEPDNPNLIGTWTGHRERIASTEGYRNGDATLTVTDQTGWTFDPVTLDYCYSEHGAGYRTTCARLQKEL
jgi:hypothetical protein